MAAVRGSILEIFVMVAMYILDNGDSYSCLPSDVDKIVRFLFSSIFLLVLLPMLVGYFNGCMHARRFGITA
jgi:hypothetical protein